MELTVLLLRQIAIMFILMGIGFIFYRRKLITDEGSRDFAKVLINLVVPVVVLSNFCIEYTPEKGRDFLTSVIISTACMLLSVLLSRLVFHKRDRISEFSAAYPNTGFIGLPLVNAVLGSQAVIHITMMVIYVNILQWTYGVYTITDDKSTVSLRKIISNPVIFAFVLGLIIFFCQIPVPSFAKNIFSIIAGLNTPLAMIVSGVYLAQSDLLKMLKNTNSYLVTLMRLIVIPLATLVLIRFLPVGSLDMKMAILIASACSCGSNVAVFAQLYHKDYVSAVEQVCMSTVFSLISIPLIISLASLLLK